LKQPLNCTVTLLFQFPLTAVYGQPCCTCGMVQNRYGDNNYSQCGYNHGRLKSKMESILPWSKIYLFPKGHEKSPITFKVTVLRRMNGSQNSTCCHQWQR